MSTAVDAVAPEPFEIPCRDGLYLRGDLYRAESAVGSVIVSHGFKGFARWAFFPYLSRTLAANGLNAIAFDFSGSGIGRDRETFTEPEAFAHNTFTRDVDDLELIEDHARRMNWISGKFGLFGHSRGGGMAILYTAAEGSNVNALVTWAAISYPNRWSPEDVVAWRRRGFTEITNARTGQVMRLETDLLEDVEHHGKTKVNIEAAAAKIKVPWLIVHGTGDETVPSSEAERLHTTARGVSTLRLIDGSGHTFEAKHPLNEIPKSLETVVKETTNFFLRNAARK
ncbi:MAG TPA: alpha/beta fold hydrolase [Gemmatimonadaceae bacterium]|nr:alpha/beta fold hydrolase [Gemmatimonadaceae bacterium]